MLVCTVDISRIYNRSQITCTRSSAEGKVKLKFRSAANFYIGARGKLDSSDLAVLATCQAQN